jgi:hypothetical protein
MGVLTLPALLPMLVVAGRRPLTLVLLLPAGGVLAAAAAVLAVATRGSLTVSIVVVDVVANAVAAAIVLRRRRNGAAWVTSAADSPRVLAGAAVAAVVGLAGLSRPALDWDARSIWLLHARLLRAGGGHYVDALHNSAYTFAHVDYPPLAAATVAEAWKVWGASSYRLAQVLLALQGMSLVVAAAMLLGRRVTSAPRWLAPALAAAYVIAALGPIGLYLTNGYADVVVAGGAAIAAIALLVEPVSGEASALGLFGALVAALTKDEGLVAALLVVGLWLVRLLLTHRLLLRRAGRRAAVVVAAMLVWPALVVARGGPRGSVLGAGTVAAAAQGHLTRLAHAASNLASHLLVLPVVLIASVALVVAARQAAERSRLQPVAWLWALVGVQLIVLLATYTFGKMPIHYWLRTSGDRVSIFPAMVLDAIAVLAVADMAVAIRMRR